MVEEGVLDGVDAVIALHVASDLPANQIMIEGGYTTANEDSFRIILTGTGGHGAYPHQGTDPTFILAQVINAIQGIRSRRIDPTKAATISIGSIHAGTVSNVIPSKVEITGTMRSFDDETREKLKIELTQALGVAQALGGDFTVTFNTGYPATYNDPTVAGTIRQTVTDLVGAAAVMTPEAGMGAEDFSYMARKAPGAMFMLGAKYDEVSRPHHTPVFDISETVLPYCHWGQPY
ncbi:MAG: amidohydrolase, partial [Chloroflexi bacterium]|nr:amidohydrolase [Chloroflexota bacterium]